MPALLLVALFLTDDPVVVSAAVPDADGVAIHDVRSPYQSGTTQIRVLAPRDADASRRVPAVYVLPVEAGTESRYGDGLAEVRKLDLHNRLKAAFVAPTFSHLPWYADHPTDPEIRQETYFLKVVVPAIDERYPVKGEAVGRLLLGFSKSGWGAFSLLLRHPDTFGKAAAFDAPLMMSRPNRYGMADIVGTQENFELYQISRLAKDKARQFQKAPRLLLLGQGNFQTHHEQAHTHFSSLKLPHDYRLGPLRKHDWHSGWVQEGAEWLLNGGAR